MVGPDAGVVTCEVDGGRVRARVNLLDKWAYFWRLAVVPLVDDLPPGAHVATVRLEAAVPDAKVLKRRPGGPAWEQFRREGKEHKLWMMHWLIEEESDRERALTTRARGAPASQQTARLGGAGVARGGRRADE